MAIKINDKISLDYEGKLEDGTVFDSSKHGDHSHPLEFTAGSGMVIKGFDDAIIGMNVSEEKSFSIEPNEAYGEYKKDLIKNLPREILPKDQVPQPGMMIVLATNDGKQFPAKIVEVTNSYIAVDLNHPLAGKKLFFKIKILKVN